MTSVDQQRRSAKDSKLSKEKNVSTASNLQPSILTWLTPSEKTAEKMSGEPMPGRLPLYGPLNLKSVQSFLQEARERFEKMYTMRFPYCVKPSDFEPMTLLGKGAFGKVILVRDKKDQAYYAMKACHKRHLCSMKQVTHALNEKRILQCVDFPLAVRMEYFSKDNSYIYFFMPFISGGEMFNHLQKVRKFPENQARFYAAQVTLGLEYLHYLRIAYRDLKPENILLDHYGYIKITDFGFCKQVQSRTYTFCGTPHYLAPEVITGHGYGFSCDWWSLGVLIFEMCSGNTPFDSDDQMTMFKFIVSGRFVMPQYFGPPLRDIISKLLQVDVTRRFGVLHHGAEDVKSHEWFRSISWLEILNRRVAPPFVPQTKGPGDVSQFPSGEASVRLEIANTNEYEDEFKDF